MEVLFEFRTFFFHRMIFDTFFFAHQMSTFQHIPYKIVVNPCPMHACIGSVAKLCENNEQIEKTRFHIFSKLQNPGSSAVVFSAKVKFVSVLSR